MDRIEGTTRKGEPYRIIDGQPMEILRNGTWIQVEPKNKEEEPDEEDSKKSS